MHRSTTTQQSLATSRRIQDYHTVLVRFHYWLRFSYIIVATVLLQQKGDTAVDVQHRRLSSLLYTFTFILKHQSTSTLRFERENVSILEFGRDGRGQTIQGIIIVILAQLQTFLLESIQDTGTGW